MKLLLMILLLSNLGYGQQAFSINDYTSDQIEILKGLSGDYENVQGDQLEVTFKFMKEEQPSLFGPSKFHFYGLFESSDYVGYSFDMRSFTKSEDSYSFSNYLNDCDYPGCSDYEVMFTFKKNEQGIYDVTIDTSVVVDAEDIAYYYEEEDFDYDTEDFVIEEWLDKECRDYYGNDAYLVDYHDGYTPSVYCGYERQFYLRKVK